MSLRLGFLGTGDFAVPSLRALHGAGHTLALVVCQPDRPKGRGQQRQAPPVKQAALELGLRVLQPERMRDPEAVKAVAEAGLDLACVVAYGQILPQSVLDAPRLGCINVHASLLPRWRGAAPIEWALAAGDALTGVCVQRMVYKLDAGEVLLSASRAVTAEDDGPGLHAELALSGAGLLLKAVDGLAAGTLTGVAQDESAATLAPLLKKSDGYADFSAPRAVVLNRFRAFKARPGVWALVAGSELVKIHAMTDAGNAAGEPGILLAMDDQGLKVCCADGAVNLGLVQPASGKVMAGAAFARGRGLQAGVRFVSPVSSTALEGR